MTPLRLGGLIVLGAAVGAGLATLERWLVHPRGSVAVHAAEPPDETVDADPPADWCAPGYEPIGGGCLALPARSDATRPLILYLHGRYAGDAAAEEVDRQKRLASRATERGFAVLAVRGPPGVCTAPDLAAWYCWPSNRKSEARAPEIVAGWRGALAEAGRRAGARTRVVLGFSSGGYFASLLATRGLVDADAFVIAHGGAVEPVRAARGTPPLLLLSADDDVAQDDMLALGADLEREGWAHDAYARAGAHGLTDGDIDEALAFFTRSHERLPLDPPLSLHRPEHHAHTLAEAAAPSAPQADPMAEVPAP